MSIGHKLSSHTYVKWIMAAEAIVDQAGKAWYTGHLANRVYQAGKSGNEGRRKEVSVSSMIKDLTLPRAISNGALAPDYQHAVRDVVQTARAFDIKNVTYSAEHLFNVFAEDRFVNSLFTPAQLLLWSSAYKKLTDKEGGGPKSVKQLSPVLKMLRSVIAKLEKGKVKVVLRSGEEEHTLAIYNKVEKTIVDTVSTQLIPLEIPLTMCRSILDYAEKVGMVRNYEERTIAVAKDVVWHGFVVEYTARMGFGDEGEVFGEEKELADTTSTTQLHMLEIVNQEIHQDQPTWSKATPRSIVLYEKYCTVRSAGDVGGEVSRHTKKSLGKGYVVRSSLGRGGPLTVSCRAGGLRVRVHPVVPNYMEEADVGYTLSCLTRSLFTQNVDDHVNASCGAALDRGGKEEERRDRVDIANEDIVAERDEDGEAQQLAEANRTVYHTGVSFNSETMRIEYGSQIRRTSDATFLHCWPLINAVDPLGGDEDMANRTVVFGGKGEACLEKRVWTLHRRMSLMIAYAHAWGASVEVLDAFFANKDVWAALPFCETFRPLVGVEKTSRWSKFEEGERAMVVVGTLRGNKKVRVDGETFEIEYADPVNVKSLLMSVELMATVMRCRSSEHARFRFVEKVERGTGAITTGDGGASFFFEPFAWTNVAQMFETHDGRWSDSESRKKKEGRGAPDEKMLPDSNVTFVETVKKKVFANTRRRGEEDVLAFLKELEA